MTIDIVNLPASEIIPIHPLCKYIIKINFTMSEKELMDACNQIENWWESSSPFLILDQRFTLVKVSEADVIGGGDVQEKEED